MERSQEIFLGEVEMNILSIKTSKIIATDV